MAQTIPVIQVGVGKQRKVVEPKLLVGLNNSGQLVPIKVTIDGKIKTSS